MFKVLWVTVCITGLLASIFNWDWYFKIGRAKFTDNMLGRGAHRVINAAVSIFLAAGGAFFLE